MDWDRRLKAVVVSTLVRDTPRKFWEDFRAGTIRTYLDVFEEVRTDPNVIEVQRIDKLYQDRHFRMEHLLSALAASHCMACTSTPLVENNRHYVYATAGAIGLTQAYVPVIGELPQPARFRERHAELNEIPNKRRLDLGDEPPEVMLGKDFYGLLAHNPAGKRFKVEEQRLGMLQLCVPHKGMADWAVQLAMEEIIGSYESLAPRKAPERRGLPWKKPGKKEGDEKK